MNKKSNSIKNYFFVVFLVVLVATFLVVVFLVVVFLTGSFLVSSLTSFTSFLIDTFLVLLNLK